MAVALAPQVAQAHSIVVDNSDGDASYYQDVELGTTLRGAIDFLNSGGCTGSDSISFSGPFTISVSSDLPTINCGGLSISGFYNGQVGVTITPAYGGFSGAGLDASATPNVSVQGVEVWGWTYGTGISGTIDVSDSWIHDNEDGVDTWNPSSITNNQIYSNGTGIYAVYGGHNISNNQIWNASWDAMDIYVANGSYNGSDTVNNNQIGWYGGIGYDGIYAYGSAINASGNSIVSSFDYAVDLEEDVGSTISSNKLGLDPGGSIEDNGGAIYIWASQGSTIDGNVIAGSASYGGHVQIYGTSSDITVSNNLVGQDSSGDDLTGDASSVVLAQCGSNISVHDNVLAAYGLNGVAFFGVTGGGSMDIANNRINVQSDGVTSLGGLSYGILLETAGCSTGPLLTERASAKSVSAGGASGAAAHGPRRSAAKMKRAAKTALLAQSAPAGATTGLTISNNTIRYVGSDGIFIDGGFNNSITGNTITDNYGYGVNIITGTGNSITGNSAIYNNALSVSGFQKNVNLDFPGGVLRNDDQSFQPGEPNDGQTPPIITGASHNYSNGTTTVTFTLAAPAGSYLVTMCENNPTTSVPGCSGIVGTANVTVSSGPAAGSVTFGGVSQDNFSANATSSNNDTSEFSEVFAITPAPAMTLSSTTVNFGNIAAGSSSSPQTINVTSTGTTPLNLNALSSPSCTSGLPLCYGGGFTCTTTCAVNNPYIPGGGCTITATFNPTAITTYSTTIGVCVDPPAYGGTITLTGAGVTPPPVAFNPASFDFGKVPVGTTTAPPQAFTLFNGGVAPVTLGEPSVDDADFQVVSNGCGTSIAPNTSCDVMVVFSPLGAATYHGTLSIPSGSAPAALRLKRAVHGKAAIVSGPAAATASLVGTGTAVGAISLPSALDLGTYTLGDPPNTKVVTLTNTGTAPVNINTLSVSGPFTLVSTCGPSIAPTTSCTITIGYSTADLGIHTGTLTVVTDAAGASGAIPLTGNTVPSPVPVIKLAPTQIGFGDRLLGSSSGTQRITISNVGNAPATLQLSMSNYDFLLVFTSCGASLAPAESCYADVALRPVGFGPRTGSFIVTTNAAGSPFGVLLGGSGCRPFSAGSSRLGSSISCSP
ncbi:MAG TPA: choice-of-anchor D domain-containing protein [Usitatibacter sp.]|nr:choice-of-anchor D domain-containing protein [Usitatibacter sp.]